MTVKELVLFVIGALISIFLLSCYFFGLDYFFKPKEEALKCKTFEQSQSYNEGMVRRLNDLKIQYESAKDENQKASLRSVIQHEFSVYPKGSLPSYLENFLNSIGG